ncbi:MAG TPA: hypothetical protein PLG77_03055, partial [Burkholderiaceae bacterium]|nr:hypothetical protein [Burkholderiaceae bacterium]
MTCPLHPVLAGIAALSLAGAANASVVTFDDLPVSGNSIFTFVSSGGFDFNGGHFHIIDTPDSRIVGNGTQFLGAEALRLLKLGLRAEHHTERHLGRAVLVL